MKILATLLLLLSTSSAFAAEEAIRTNLRALHFNSAGEDFYESQTVVTVRGNPGKQTLTVRYALPGAEISYTSGPIYHFLVNETDNYLAYIAKYQTWSAQATENGDAFSKEIGKAKAGLGLTNQVGFHSGNAKQHYLTVTVCSLGNCGVSEPLYLDEKGAEELAALLTKLKAGQLPGEDVGDKYN